MKFRRIFVVLGLVCASAVAVYWLVTDRSWGDSVRQAEERAPMTVPQVGDAPASPASLATESERIAAKLAVTWLEQYGEAIQQPAVQAQFTDLQREVLAAYPDQGMAIFQRAIWLAFPNFAQDILTLLARMQVYQQWLAANDLLLRNMPLLEREGSKWRKRMELFGPDAELIWAEEKAEWAQRQHAVQQTIATLDQADEYSLDETLFQLQSAIEESYGSGWQTLVMDNGMIATVYFGLESVQTKLRSMSPEQRQQQINRIRSNLGYSEAQVERLAEQDQRRNQRWENGLAYMNDRAQLSQSLTGDALTQALSDLREQYFAHEAVTIEREEADGFYRYQRPRLYGRN